MSECGSEGEGEREGGVLKCSAYQGGVNLSYTHIYT